MLDFKLEIAKIVGTPSGGSWSQVHTFIPEDSEKLRKRGELLAVISLPSVEAGIETVALGREILSRLHEEYFGNLEGGVLERLKLSLEKINSEWPQTEITAGIVFSFKGKKILYLGILGKGRVLVKREGNLNEVLFGQNDLGVEVGSGLLETGDILLLGNENFFQIASAGVIKAALGLSNPQEMVESLAPIILSQSEIGQPAAVIGALSEAEAVGEELTSFAPESQQAPSTSSGQALSAVSSGRIGSGQSNLFLAKLFRLKEKIHLPKINKSIFRIRRVDNEEKQKAKKVTIFIAGILVFLFLASLILGVGKKRKTENEAKAKILFTQARSKYNEAGQMIDLDVMGARVLLNDSLKILEQAKKLSSDPEITVLSKDVEKLLSGNEKEKQLDQLPVFFDLGLIKEQTRASAIAGNKSTLAVLDSVKGLLGILDLEKKSSKFLVNEELEGAQTVHFIDGIVYVLAGDGILSVDVGQKKIIKVISKDNSWEKIVAMNSFGGNLYLLDSAKNMIWQHIKGETGYLPAKAWLAVGFPKQFEPVSFAIDGAIWVLGKGGQILKFTRGSQDNFETKGIKKEQLANVDNFYTDEDSRFLYLLDSKGKKLTVFSKDGQFQKQYQWAGGPDGQAYMAVWEEKSKIFLIKDNSVFSFLTD